MADNVRPLDSAPSAQAAQRKQAYRERAQIQEREHRARRITEELKANGAAVVACSSDAEREEARDAGRHAGRLLSCSVRTKVLQDGRVAVWQPDRHDNPLHARLDEQRANRRIDAYFAEHGPLIDPPPQDPQA